MKIAEAIAIIDTNRPVNSENKFEDVFYSSLVTHDNMGT